jgi:hypothetical protein
MCGTRLYGPRDIRFEKRADPNIVDPKPAREFGATDIVTERSEEGAAKVKELTDGLGGHSVVDMVPSVCEKLVKLGTEVSMQSGAGESAGLPDSSVGKVTFTADPWRLVRLLARRKVTCFAMERLARLACAGNGRHVGPSIARWLLRRAPWRHTPCTRHAAAISERPPPNIGALALFAKVTVSTCLP